MTTTFTMVRIYNDHYSCSIPIQVAFYLYFYFPAGKLTRLSLIAIQVVCNIYNTILQPERSHNLVCMLVLCYAMLLEESGVL